MAVLPFSSVTQLCLTLCDPMDCSTPGLPVHHQLPEPIQTHVHRVGDAVQPSHPLSSPSPPAFDLSQHQGLFQWVSSSHQVATVLEFQLSLSQKQLLLSLGEDVSKHLILLPPETSLKTAISKRSHEYNDEENRRGDKSSKILKVAKQMNHGHWLSMPKKAGCPSQQQGKLKTSTVKAWGRQENKLLTRPCPLSLRSVFQSCPAPCDPMDCSRPGSSVHGDSPVKNAGVGFQALHGLATASPLSREKSEVFPYVWPSGLRDTRYNGRLRHQTENWTEATAIPLFWCRRLKPDPFQTGVWKAMQRRET